MLNSSVGGGFGSVGHVCRHFFSVGFQGRFSGGFHSSALHFVVLSFFLSVSLAFNRRGTGCKGITSAEEALHGNLFSVSRNYDQLKAD